MSEYTSGNDVLIWNCFSDENGLYLVLGQVMEDGPAYESGLRSGDVIVTVSDWLITVMDRPQVPKTSWTKIDYWTIKGSSYTIFGKKYVNINTIPSSQILRNFDPAPLIRPLVNRKISLTF